MCDTLKVPSPRAVEGLLSWFGENARPLPWREREPRQTFPYRVLLSESMLQQTRVEAVLPHYAAFLLEAPDFPALASLPEERLLKLWQGLGYYSRARNLQAAARMVLSEYGGLLPRERSLLRGLPGVGPYTAGAIASIAYNIAEPAFDGNAARLLSRFAARRSVSRREGEAALRAMIPRDRAGAFTEAIMELGEVVCLPHAAPLCGRCPLQGECRGRAEGDPARYPSPPPKKPRRVQERTVLLLRDRGEDGERFYLRRRPARGLLAGMFEFPGYEGFLTERDALAHARELGFRPESASALSPARHLFTHIEWRMRLFEVIGRFPEGFALPPGALLAAREEVGARYAIPSAFAALLRRIQETPPLS